MNTPTIVHSSVSLHEIGCVAKERLIKLAEHLEQANISECDDPIGLAGTLPWFREQGFITVEDVVSGERNFIYGKHTRWDAVEEFFELLPVEAEILFSLELIPGKSSREIARHIRRIVRRWASY